MNALINALIAATIVSLLSLVGIFTINMRKKTLDEILHILVGFSVGALMGGAFLHLIPEAVEKFGISSVTINVLIGFAFFFLLERALFWHHCHKHGGKCDVHMFTYMNLIGDGVHNLIDGMIIVVSFMADYQIGIATTIAVMAHELPQEIGDFGVLVYGGFSRVKALIYNFASALTAIIGVFIGYYLYDSLEMFNQLIIPFAAGGFIYIAASDLIPELHKEPNMNKSMQSFSLFIIGIIFMYAVKIILA